MTATGAALGRAVGRIIHWTAVVELVLQHGNPLGIGIVVTVVVGQRVGIAEIVHQGILNVSRIGTRGIRTIAHLHAHARVVLQQRHRVDFVGTAVVVQEVGHQLITVVRLPEIGRQGAIGGAAIAGAIIAMRACTCLGPLPITHQLAHGAGHTTHLHMAVIAFGVFGTMVVV